MYIVQVVAAEQELLAAVVHVMSEAGVDLRPSERGADLLDVVVDDIAAGSRRPVVIGTPALPGAPSAVDAATMFIAERVPHGAAADLRRRGVWFADASGNAYIRAPGVVVDVRGAANRRRHGRRPAIGARPANVMSARRAQVIACLLTWPDELLGGSLRAIARSAGVALGTAQETVSILVDEGYVTRDGSTLLRRAELVDRWADAFPAGLGRALELGRFVGAPSPDAWLDRGHDVDVSGLAASDLRGDDLVLYVRELDLRSIIRSEWRKGDRPNVVLRRKFYTTPHESDSIFGSLHVAARAPALLVYGDLLASGDPRQKQAASDMRSSLV